ncbi:hypothetical protein GS4_26_01350 [Gordonia soli NBRC 108243]|uniref:ABC transporter substrate-binding protein n=1 Tax=Gordonia soli NBRC 108243 TaxID=1223545 RepID=M0QQF9_9ACTN|nr:hypothetical protein GS4_26_01350 [Gordonia soli NBRC 108243]
MSRGVVAVLLALVLVGGLVVVWRQLGDHIARQGDAAAGVCVEGDTTVSIIADPGLADGLGTIAKQYSSDRPIVRDHCITVAVRAGDPKVTLDGLVGGWDTKSLGAEPSAWVPQSSVWSSELTTARPDAVEGDARSLVTSPVVLATAPDLAKAAAASGLDWGQLPTLQRRDNSLSDLGLPKWGSLRLAMPTGAQSDPTALAAQAVATQVTRSDSLTAEDAALPRVASSIEALTDGAPSSPDGSASGAVKQIAEAADDSAASIHAVPITEQQLYQLTRGDNEEKVSEVLPSGPTPFADFPVVRLAGSGVSAVQTDAVSDFFDYVAKPEHLATLTALGFRGDAPLPEPTPTVTFPVTREPLPVPPAPAVLTINRLVFGRDFGPPASSAEPSSAATSPAAGG